MKKMLSVLLVIYSLVLNVAAQQKDCCNTKADILLSMDKPTVYLSFERIEKRKLEPARLATTESPVGKAQEQTDSKSALQVIRFRLHNNTRWAISFSTDSLYVGPKTAPLRLSGGRGALGLRDGVEVNIRYGIEPEPGRNSIANLPMLDRIDVYSTSWLPSGHSVTFIVPREHAVRDTRVYVSFNYEWETTEGDNGSSEPEHRVYFRSSDLPKGVAER
jgi:hypothetical protein